MTPQDAERTLRERLIDAGAKFKGRFPSATEVGDGSSGSYYAMGIICLDPLHVLISEQSIPKESMKASSWGL